MRCVATARLIPAVVLIVLGGPACNRSQPDLESGTPAATAPAADPRSDRQISTAVQAKYYTDDTVRGRQIDVSAENGIVTLRGTVESEAAKQHAVNLARSVDGVARVEDELEVRQTAGTTAPGRSQEPTTTGTAGERPHSPQPSWITTKIQAQYFLDPDIKPWNIDVTTARGGIVTLEGTVDTPENRVDAVRIARETEGVTRVEDYLKIQTDARSGAQPNAGDVPGLAPPDAWVTAKIQAKYFVDDDVKGRTVDVDTRNGVVTLKGTVASKAERRQAVAIARNTDGVRDVSDQLRVEGNVGDRKSDAAVPAAKGPGIETPDAWITMKIQAKYFLDADVKGRAIEVDTANGLVTLKGTVESALQKTEAEEIARETEGVKRVVNQLTIRTAPNP
jgi:osmotically-inducible protein OsmY